MQTYLSVDEFCKLVHLNKEVVLAMVDNNSLKYKKEDGEIFIEAAAGTFSIVPSKKGEVGHANVNMQDPQGFVEKTIGTILNLHEKVLDAKDETLEVLKNENTFLKDALYSMQELYDEDRKTIETLNLELENARKEIEFLKRKYKLMWNKAVENYKTN